MGHSYSKSSDSSHSDEHHYGHEGQHMDSNWTTAHSGDHHMNSNWTTANAGDHHADHSMDSNWTNTNATSGNWKDLSYNVGGVNNRNWTNSKWNNANVVNTNVGYGAGW